MTSGWKNIRVWSVQSGDLLETLNGYSDQVGTAFFSPDGSTLYVSNFDQTSFNTMVLRNARTKEAITTLEARIPHLNSFEMFQCGSMLLTNCLGNVEIWRLPDLSGEFMLFGVTSVISKGNRNAKMSVSSGHSCRNTIRILHNAPATLNSASLTIYTATGRVVARLDRPTQVSGSALDFSVPAGLSRGAYYYRFTDEKATINGNFIRK